MSHTIFEPKQKDNRRILLTGAAGTLGASIARLLARETQCTVIAPIRRFDSGFPLPEAQFKPICLDLSAAGSIESLVARARPDAIIHCATSGLRPPLPPLQDIIAFNVATTCRLFEAYCSSQASHFIHISTGMIYCEQNRPIGEEDPIGTVQPYAASKAAADLLLQAAAVESGRRLTILRPFGITGAGDFSPRLFPSLIEAAAARRPMSMTAGGQLRNYCAAEDIAQAVLCCLNHDRDDPIAIFNLGGEAPMSVRAAVEMVCSDLDLSVDIQFGQKPYPPHEPMQLVADFTAARHQLGWQPTIRLSYAVWELARELAPGLALRKPERNLCLTAATCR
jgi:nucleoside-diphosphate-sugar epimerase